ncbi:MAG: hypothetical protein H0T46_14615 [Deltaproteobacteria bacterium]|nr:hypothetical protein [Deltaproteobacteria bacterium]
MNARWLAIDRNGHIAVFDSEVRVPVIVDEPEAGHELVADIVRVLRLDRLPVRGRHAHIRAGAVLMVADEELVREEKAAVEPVTREVIAARFPPARRGREASFMTGVRTFGEGDEQSPFERLHEGGVCEGCSVEGADEKPDQDGLAAHGLYVFATEDHPDLLLRQRVPTMPLHAARIGELAARCLHFSGTFTEEEEIERNDFE